MRSARSGSSVPGVRTPTQTSPPGSWRRCRSLHTTGMASVMRADRTKVRPMAGLRAHGLRIGELEPGPANAITDVPGVAVGHVTVIRDEPEPPAGRGVARTGVTAIVPPAL